MGIPEVPDWVQLIQLLGQYDGVPTLVAVDASGNIIAVMKATYAGTLKNMACDAQGRLIMIPTDPADVWGNAISMGNAELAAVLSPARRYDRRGNVVFFSSFEAGFGGFNTNTVVSGDTMTITTDYARSAPFAAKLHTTNNALAKCQLIRYQPYLVLGNNGFEVSFTLGAHTAWVKLTLDLFEGGTGIYARVRYTPDSDKWEYQTATDAWADLLTSYPMYENDYLFHTAKLVVDFKNREFLRFLVNEQEKSMTGIATYTAAVAPNYALVARFEAAGEAGGAEDVYVDDVCITANEPP